MTDVSAVTVRPPYLCPSEGHKHGVSIQSSIHLGDTLLQIMRRFLAMLLIYQSFMVSQILDLIHWTVTIFSFDHMTSENQEYTKQSSKKHLHRRKSYNSVLTCNPGLALTAFRTIVPCFQQVNQTWARPPLKKPALGQRSTSKKHVTSMSYKLEPKIWSCDTGQWIPCFERCQLIITWMSNISEVHSKPCHSWAPAARRAAKGSPIPI